MGKIRPPKRDVYCTNRKTIRESIPFTEMYADGMMRCSAEKKRSGEINTFSMCYRIIDMNYESADGDEQQLMLQRWYEILNLFDSTTTLQIMVINRTPSRDVLEATTQMQLRGDENDFFRSEHNCMMDRKLLLGGKRKVFKEKYLTISTIQKNKEQAERYFARIKSELKQGFAKMGSGISQLGEIERAKIMHDIYRQKHEDEFWYDPKEMKKRGHTVKECIAPFNFKVFDEYMEVGEKYAQCLTLFQYPQFVEDVIIKKLTDIEKNMVLTITLVPIERQDALDQCNTVYTNIDSEIAKFTRKQVSNKNFNATIPVSLEEKKNSIIDLRNDIANRDQGIFFMNLSIAVFGETPEEMQDAGKMIIEIGRQKQCKFIVNKYLQEDTFNSCLPIGQKFIENWRTMTSESVAAFNPFVARELLQPGGLYYGNHAITGTVIIGNRDLLDNGNAIIVGASGKGKSMFAKAEMIQIFLKMDENTDIIVIDPDREFARICDLFHGENIVLSANSPHHINPMKLTDEKYLFSEDKPLPLKIEFLQTVFEQLLGVGEITNGQKSLIDRGLRKTYKEAKKGDEPTLQDFYHNIKAMEDEGAAELVLALERFIEGSLDTFAQKSNIDTTNRFTVYDINELGAGLKDVGMSIMLDAILSKVTENRVTGRKTVIYCDEFWIMMKHEYSARYIDMMWRLFRKYGAWVTGITQNLRDLMRCETGESIVNNATIAVLLGQNTLEKELLKEAYSLTETQCVYIDDSPPGHGLLKFGDTFVPFENEFDKSLTLYKAITTKPQELQEYAKEQA